MGGLYFIGNWTGGIALGTLVCGPDVDEIPFEITGFTEGVNTCFFRCYLFLVLNLDPKVWNVHELLALMYL